MLKACVWAMSDGFDNYSLGFMYLTSFKALTINEVEG